MTQMTASYAQDLPSELWLEIFRLAALPEDGVDYHSPAYLPFQPAGIRSHILDPTVEVKRSITLVCRRWYLLATKLLYEDIRISNSISSLQDAIDREGEFRKWVRRVVLPYRSTVPNHTRKMQSVTIMRSLPNVETLVRPPAFPAEPRFNYESESLPLESLRRLDWWYNQEAERSGGINSLGTMLACTARLQYLAIGGFNPYGRLSIGEVPLSLPHLETLRLNGVNPLMVRQLVSDCALPALACLVLDKPVIEFSLRDVLAAYGRQLQTVELGRHLHFYANDFVGICLEECPQLTELNYYLFFTTFPEVRATHPSLKTVGLHVANNSLIDDVMETHIGGHLGFLTKENFPAMQTINIYGLEDALIFQSAFSIFTEGLRTRGFSVNTIS